MSQSPRPSSPIGFYDHNHGRHSPSLDASWPQLSPQLPLQELDDYFSFWAETGKFPDIGHESYPEYICPIRDCGRHVKDLEAHLLTHRNAGPEKCPIATCEYSVKGFARKYDRNRHTWTHYRGILLCGFCPAVPEKTFRRADVFKHHLVSVHGVEPFPPRPNRKKPAGATQQTTSGACSICSMVFGNVQDFFEHLDQCVLRVVERSANDANDANDENDEKNDEEEEEEEEGSDDVEEEIAVSRPAQNVRDETAFSDRGELSRPSALSQKSSPHPTSTLSNTERSELKRDEQGEQDEPTSKRRKLSPVSPSFTSNHIPLGNLSVLATQSGKLLEPERVREVPLSPATIELNAAATSTSEREATDYYPPLAHRGMIRILSVSDPTAKKYEMFTINYEDPASLPYIALSYAWGPPLNSETPVNRILVNNNPWIIRSNLYQFLQKWGPTLHRKNICLWADAICIDQSNTAERERQVAQMGEIFKRANAVWAWLGSSSLGNSITGVFEKLHEWTVRFWTPADDAPFTPDAMGNYGGPDCFTSSRFWVDFTKMIVRPWWMRAWIVQEVTCNPSTFLLCGSTCMRYSAWRDSLHAVNKGIVLKSKIKASLWDDFREHFNAAITLLNLGERLAQSNINDVSPAIAFLETLELLSHTKCTDPRDKVYAILGLTPELVRSTFLPDYQISSRDLWLQVTRFLSSYMPDGQKLEFLRDVPNERERARSTADHPSWLVDWSQVNSEQSRYFAQYRGGKRFYNPDYWNYTAPLIEDKRLIMRGACLGTVTEALPSWMENGHVNSSQLLAICQDVAKRPTPYFTEESLTDVVDRTVIMDLDWSHFPHITRGGSANWDQYMNDGSTLETSAYEQWRHHGHSLSMAAKNRRLFWTDNVYLGLGPLRLREGDKLCVFFGSQMLHLLSERAEGRYEYIGEAYVHGLMDGEAIGPINEEMPGGELFIIE